MTEQILMPKPRKETTRQTNRNVSDPYVRARKPPFDLRHTRGLADGRHRESQIKNRDSCQTSRANRKSSVDGSLFHQIVVPLWGKFGLFSLSIYHLLCISDILNFQFEENLIYLYLGFVQLSILPVHRMLQRQLGQLQFLEVGTSGYSFSV